MTASTEPRAELEDVTVERVDAVDKPATGRRWLLMKSEEGDEMAVNVEELEKAVRSALEAIAKAHSEDGLDLTEEAVAALNTVAKMLSFGQEFKARKKSDGKKLAEHGYPQPEKKMEATIAQPSQMAQAAPAIQATNMADSSAAKTDNGYGYPGPMNDVIAKLIEALNKLNEKLDQLASKSAPVPSRQVAGQDVVTKRASKKLGEGVFTDVVFGN